MNSLVIKNESDYQFVSKLAQTYSKSGLVPQAYKNRPADCFLALSMGGELGLGPVQSLQAINVIQGRPSLSAQTMLALIKSKFPDAYIKIIADSTGAECTMGRHQDDKNTYTAVWDHAKAKAMGLTGKDNWIKQFSNMCRWRCISEASRFMFPDVIMNLYSPDEIEDFTKTPQQEQDEDFPNPNENIEIGSPDFKLLYGKFRGKHINELPEPEIEERVEYLENKKATKGITPKYEEELNALVIYMQNIEQIIEAEANQVTTEEMEF